MKVYIRLASFVDKVLIKDVYERSDVSINATIVISIIELANQLPFYVKKNKLFCWKGGGSECLLDVQT